MYGFFVNKYFVKVEKGMDKDHVIDGPVYLGNSHDDEIGRIIDYNPKNGIIKIELNDAVDYKYLLSSGVPLKHIIFNNRA